MKWSNLNVIEKCCAAIFIACAGFAAVSIAIVVGRNIAGSPIATSIVFTGILHAIVTRRAK